MEKNPRSRSSLFFPAPRAEITEYGFLETPSSPEKEPLESPFDRLFLEYEYERGLARAAVLDARQPGFAALRPKRTASPGS